MLSYIVFDWTHSQYETRPSPEDDNVIDQPAEATAWLNKLSVVNQNHIKQVLSCMLVTCVHLLVTRVHLLVTPASGVYVHLLLAGGHVSLAGGHVSIAVILVVGS